MEENLEIIGKKLGMTQIYDESNKLVAVTVIEVGPCPVLQLKTQESDGYNAVQIGFGPQKEQRVSQALIGHCKKAGVEPVKTIREFRTNKSGGYQLGQVIGVDNLTEGQYVDVIATTKGRGFQGVVKRHGFSGQHDSHGSMMHRRPGSIGNRQWPGEVYKGKPMPGNMGNDRRTMQNLVVVKIIKDKNVVLVSGSVPGNNGSLVVVRNSKKKSAKKAGK